MDEITAGLIKMKGSSQQANEERIPDTQCFVILLSSLQLSPTQNTVKCNLSISASNQYHIISIVRLIHYLLLNIYTVSEL